MCSYLRAFLSLRTFAHKVFPRTEFLVNFIHACSKRKDQRLTFPEDKKKKLRGEGVTVFLIFFYLFRSCRLFVFGWFCVLFCFVLFFFFQNKVHSKTSRFLKRLLFYDDLSVRLSAVIGRYISLITSGSRTQFITAEFCSLSCSL